MKPAIPRQSNFTVIDTLESLGAPQRVHAKSAPVRKPGSELWHPSVAVIAQWVWNKDGIYHVGTLKIHCTADAADVVVNCVQRGHLIPFHQHFTFVEEVYKE